MPDAPQMALWRETRLPFEAPADVPLLSLYVAVNERKALCRDRHNLPRLLSGCALEREDRGGKTYLRVMIPLERQQAMRAAWEEGGAAGRKAEMEKHSAAGTVPTPAEFKAASDRGGLAAQAGYREAWATETLAGDKE